MADPKNDPPNDPPNDGVDPNEAQWAVLEDRVKKATRATMDEWWEDRKAEAKKAGGGIELDFGPLGRLLGISAGVKTGKN